MSAVGVIAITAAAVGLMAGLSRFDVLKGKVLDVSKAEAGVQRVLLDREVGYSATNVSDVECNGGKDPEIKKGASFTCEVVVEGRKRNVLVVFQDDMEHGLAGWTLYDNSLGKAEECDDAVVAARGVSAVDGDRLAADERGVRGHQERGHGGNLLGSPEPMKRVLFGDGGQRSFHTG